MASRVLVAVVVAWSCAALCPIATAAQREALQIDFAGEPASADVQGMARWVADSGDSHGQPFAIVDKKGAKVFVFGAEGRLAGAAPVLLGLAKGDDAVPGIGQRALNDILPAERTTPAGRFDSEPGRNLSGEAIVWVDYDAGFAIHRLRPGNSAASRQQRLVSAKANDHRVSLGCIVVAPAFYDAVVGATLGKRRGVVYVLPETRGPQEVFGGASYRLGSID